MKIECLQDKQNWNLGAYMNHVRPIIEDALLQYLPLIPDDSDSQFNEALRAAIFSGGKRIRPILTLLGMQVVGGEYHELMPAVAAVEYVHTSSLIFDDLPGMDNATLRRGRSSLHIHYGEGLVILAALALLNTSYGLVLNSPGTSSECALRAHDELVFCIGSNGMIRGQAIDLALHNPRNLTDCGSTLAEAQNLKTTALFRLSLKIGAILCGAGQTQLLALSRFADLLGTAYQQIDDLVDIYEDSQRANSRNSVGVLNLTTKERVRTEIDTSVVEAKAVIAAEFCHTLPAQMLSELADTIVSRAERAFESMTD